MTRATKAALAEKVAAAMPRKEPPPFVKWVATSSGGIQRIAMPACIAGSRTPPEGWVLEGTPEDAAMKQAAEAGPWPATKDWRAVSTLPAKPVGPETEDQRKRRISTPGYGMLQYMQTVKWPANEGGEEPEDWERHLL